MASTMLITGAGGFLASHLAPAFTSAGFRVVGLGRSDPQRHAPMFDSFYLNDLSDPARVLSLIERDAPDLIVHLAAPSSVPESVRAPLADLEAHTRPTANLLEALRISGARPRVLLLSSAAVYGNPSVLPVAEGASCEPLSPYGFHKVHQEMLMKEAHVLYGIPTAVVRLFSTYGENLRRLAVWEIARRALAGDLTILGTGAESRDYLYAGDVAAAVTTIAERAAFTNDVINVASGEEVTISELAAAVYARLGVSAQPRFTGEALAGSPLRWRADTSRLQSLGWRAPEWSRGLDATCAWIRGRA